MTVQKLVQPLTVEEARDFVYATLAARGAKTTTWKPGAVVRTIIYALALLAAAFSALQVKLAQSAFLDSSTGAWLTIVARHIYGVRRLEGSFATGVVVANNTGGGLYTLDPGDLIVRGALNGKEYRNTEPVTIGSLATNVSIPIRAVEIGSESSAGANTITEMTTPLPGVVVANPLPLTGTDPETDEQLRARCRSRLAALSPNGPRDAYVYAATSAKRPDGSEIGITRVETIPDGYGNVEVFVADADGIVSPGDLAIVEHVIKTQVEPIGVNAIVQSAAPRVIDVAYELWIRRTSMSDVQLKEHIDAFLIQWMATIRIGGQRIPPSTEGYVFASAVQAAISQSLGEPPVDAVPVRVVVTLPSADVLIAPHEAPVLGDVTATAIYQIAEDA